MRNNKGQSLVEVVLAIGVVVLVVTGVVILIVNVVGIKANSFDRKKASDLAETVVENLIESEKNNPEEFWLLSQMKNDVKLSGFDGFTYRVEFTPKLDGNCSPILVCLGFDDNDCVLSPKCVYAKVTVNWGNNKVLTVDRFFSR